MQNAKMSHSTNTVSISRNIWLNLFRSSLLHKVVDFVVVASFIFIRLFWFPLAFSYYLFLINILYESFHIILFNWLLLNDGKSSTCTYLMSRTFWKLIRNWIISSLIFLSSRSYDTICRKKIYYLKTILVIRFFS